VRGPGQTIGAAAGGADQAMVGFFSFVQNWLGFPLLYAVLPYAVLPLAISVLGLTPAGAGRRRAGRCRTR
jgi:hypothetical protein